MMHQVFKDGYGEEDKMFLYVVQTLLLLDQQLIFQLMMLPTSATNLSTIIKTMINEKKKSI